MKLHPQGDRIVIQPVEFDFGSVIIDPDISKDAPDRGRIVALGDGFEASASEPDCHVYVDSLGNERKLYAGVGDIVLFGKFCGTSLDGELHIVRGADILARVTDVKLKEKRTIDAAGALVTI